jgi:exosortase A-associated hydrolase 2
VHETPFFFERGPWRLFAVLHQPPEQLARPFVFCHPFAEEKLWAHRVYVNFARELARRGHPVLRFDFIGNGDSDGAFAESTLETALADIDAAIELLKEKVAASTVGLLGLRLGASLAFTAAARRADVDALVMWSPVLGGSQYLQELLRINITTQVAVYREVREDREALGRTLSAGGVVNVDGYEITSDMAAQLQALSLASAAPLPRSRSLIVQIERNASAPQARELEALRARLECADLRLVQEEPFWKEIQRFYDSAPNLFSSTLQWLGYS